MRDPVSWERTASWKESICVGPDPRKPHRTLQENDIVFRRQVREVSSNGYQLIREAYYIETESILRTGVGTRGKLLARFFKVKEHSITGRAFSVIYSRTSSATHLDAAVAVSVVLVTFGEVEVVDTDGLRWYPSVNAFDAQPLCSHVMAAPRDEWTVNVKCLPHIRVQTEKAALDSGVSFVDVVDELIWNKSPSVNRDLLLTSPES